MASTWVVSGLFILPTVKISRENTELFVRNVEFGFFQFKLIRVIFDVILKQNFATLFKIPYCIASLFF